MVGISFDATVSRSIQHNRQWKGSDGNFLCLLAFNVTQNNSYRKVASQLWWNSLLVDLFSVNFEVIHPNNILLAQRKSTLYKPKILIKLAYAIYQERSVLFENDKID